METSTKMKTSMPLIAGILLLITGILRFAGIFGLGIAATVTANLVSQGVPAWIPQLLGVLAIPFLIVGILDVIAGAFAVRARNWGLALAASILSFSLFGLAALVLLIISKNEFE